jgi:hypothetical protein
VRHEELVRLHIEHFPELGRTAESFLNYSPQRVERAIRRIADLSRSCAGLEISDEREELLIRTSNRRRERLIETVRRQGVSSYDRDTDTI